ncbi:DUF106 domain-containing protein [Candidatus Pacearchaeota archaeon]|nr:DUF106 domain-containing protein [Candidatus Pacearchaeota archaeon]
MAERKTGMLWFFIIMLISLYIASKWNSLPFIKNSVNAVLNPSFGALLEWNLYIGFIVVIAFTSLVLTLSQKYLSDQDQLREIKKEQKILQEEMKKYKENPEKLLELQKKQLEFIPQTFNITLKPLIYTSIPIILLFRWFSDYFHPIFGNWWILYYMIGALVFSSIFRKLFNVA